MSSPTFSLDANSSSGCTFIGISVAIFLYGISCAQTAYYFKAYPKDSLALRSIIMVLWCFDTSRICVSLALLWSVGVQGHGSILSFLQYPVTYFGAELALTAVMILVVQSYYIYQTWLFFNGRWYKIPLTAILVTVELTGFGSGIAAIGFLSTSSKISSAEWTTRIPSLMGPLCTSLADIYITMMLTWILSKNKTGLERTNNTVTQLITFAITRGFFTALTHLGQLVLYWLEIGSFPPKLYWVMFHFPEAGVYTNSLLALLNLRRQILKRGGRKGVDYISLDPLPSRN